MVYTVLVISDHPQERAILCSLIREKLSYCAMEAGSETDAKNYLISSAKKIDLILFDISRISEPYRKISEIKNIATYIPIVVMTKFGDFETALQSIKHGAQDFLSKPVAAERMKITFSNMVLLHKLVLLNGNAKIPGNVMAVSLLDDDGNMRKMEELERMAIDYAIQFYDGCMSEVARGLGIGRSTLYRKIHSARKNQEMPPPAATELSFNNVA